jgi:hypothetical protein
LRIISMMKMSKDGKGKKERPRNKAVESSS